MLCLIYMHKCPSVYIRKGTSVSDILYLVNIPETMLYEIYTLAFPFDLRCESVTCIRVYIYIYTRTCIRVYIYMHVHIIIQ